jgi:hypothetical protein
MKGELFSVDKILASTKIPTKTLKSHFKKVSAQYMKGVQYEEYKKQYREFVKYVKQNLKSHQRLTQVAKNKARK